MLNVLRSTVVIPTSPIDADQHSVAPFFSCTYELHISQPLCFHIHACNGGVYTPSSPSGTRAVRASQHPPDQRIQRLPARAIIRPHLPCTCSRRQGNLMTERHLMRHRVFPLISLLLCLLAASF